MAQPSERYYKLRCLLLVILLNHKIECRIMRLIGLLGLLFLSMWGDMCGWALRMTELQFL